MNVNRLRMLRMGGAVTCALVVSAAVRADAPAGRYQIDVDTVYDIKTKLAWQRVEALGSMTQANAIAYCQGLSLRGSGWRLPTVKELSSLVDVTLKSPAIDPAFTGTTSNYFWSASPLAGPPNDGWNVEFNGGFTGTSVATTMYRVRCVR